MKLPYGLVNGTWTVWVSSAFRPLRSMGPSESPPENDPPLFPVLIRRNV